METDHSARGLAVALVLSVLLHLAAGLWFVIGPEDTNASPLDQTRAEIPEDTFREIEVGDPDRTAMSLSWIGLDQMRPFDAPQAEVDQAQFTPDPAPQGAQASLQPLMERITEAQAQAAEARQIVTESLRSARQAAGSLAQLLDAVAANLGTTETIPSPGGSPSPEVDEEQEPARAEESAPPPTPEPVVDVENPPGATGETGIADDRESPAVAIEPVRIRDLGGPLESQGLRIDTVRPVLHDITRLTGAPNHPIYRIHFNRSGKASDVEILSSSGRLDVDEAVRNALYRWRARGAALESLPAESPEATLAVEVRILL